MMLAEAQYVLMKIARVNLATHHHTKCAPKELNLGHVTNSHHVKSSVTKVRIT